MKFKLALMATMILFLVSPAFATIQSLTVTSPSSGQIFYPNLDDDYILATFSFRDDVNAPIHKATIKINDGDSNTAFATADTNLSTNNCTVSYGYNGGTYTCTLRYNFTGDEVTQDYELDFNITAYEGDGDFNATAGIIVPFSINNRLVSSGALVVIGLITLVMAGMLLFVLMQVLSGNADPKLMLTVLGIGIVLLVVIIVASEMILSFTP